MNVWSKYNHLMLWGNFIRDFDFDDDATDD